MKAFQTMFGLTADGIIGPATWQALYEQAQRLRSADGLLSAFNLLPWPGFELMLGAEGPSVAFVQFLLRYISYFFDTGAGPGRIDGIFGRPPWIPCTAGRWNLASRKPTPWTNSSGTRWRPPS